MIGIDNLVDVAVDAIQVGQDIATQLEDGFQILTDVPVIVFKDFSKIQNIASKAKAVAKELGDLTPDEIEDFELRVSTRTNLPQSGIVTKVRGSIRLIARGYRVGTEIADIYEDTRDLFAKAPAVAA
jgi:hypothetical protein